MPTATAAMIPIPRRRMRCVFMVPLHRLGAGPAPVPPMSALCGTGTMAVGHGDEQWGGLPWGACERGGCGVRAEVRARVRAAGFAGECRALARSSGRGAERLRHREHAVPRR